MIEIKNKEKIGVTETHSIEIEKKGVIYGVIVRSTSNKVDGIWTESKEIIEIFGKKGNKPEEYLTDEEEKQILNCI